MDRACVLNTLACDCLFEFHHRSLRAYFSPQSLATLLPLLMAECICFPQRLHTWWYFVPRPRLERVERLPLISYRHEVWLRERKSIWFQPRLWAILLRTLKIWISWLDRAELMAGLEILCLHFYHLVDRNPLRDFILKMPSKSALKMLYICLLRGLDLNVFDMISLYNDISSHWYLLLGEKRNWKYS